MIINKNTKVITRKIWGPQRVYRFTLFGYKFYF